VGKKSNLLILRPVVYIATAVLSRVNRKDVSQIVYSKMSFLLR